MSQEQITQQHVSIVELTDKFAKSFLGLDSSIDFLNLNTSDIYNSKQEKLVEMGQTLKEIRVQTLNKGVKHFEKLLVEHLRNVETIIPNPGTWTSEAQYPDKSNDYSQWVEDCINQILSLDNVKKVQNRNAKLVETIISDLRLSLQNCPSLVFASLNGSFRSLK